MARGQADVAGGHRRQRHGDDCLPVAPDGDDRCSRHCTRERLRAAAPAADGSLVGEPAAVDRRSHACAGSAARALPSGGTPRRASQYRR